MHNKAVEATANAVPHLDVREKMKIQTLLILLCLPAALAFGRPINELPMYGGKHDPQVRQNSLFSKDAAQTGWRYFYQGDYDTAIKRFNQAWMFDRENAEAYWGFGLIMGQRASQEEPKNNLKESIRFLEMAVSKDAENGKIIGDLAFSHTLLGYFYRSQMKSESKAIEHFETAGPLFEKAFSLAPEYPPIIANWAFFYFYTGDIDLARSKVTEAEKLGYRFSPDFLRALNDSGGARTRCGRQ